MRDLQTLKSVILSALDKEKNLKRALFETILEAGRALNEARAQLKHGDWERWVTENFPLSVRTANNYRRVASLVDAYPHISETISDFNATVIYAIASSNLEGELLQRLVDARPQSDEEVRRIIATFEAADLLHLTGGGRVDTTQINAVADIVRQMHETGALPDDGSGHSILLSDLADAAITEEVYERRRRQVTHMLENRPVVVVPLDDLDAAVARLREAFSDKLDALIAKLKS